MTRPGEIRPRDLERAMAQLQAALDQEADNCWFGELVTETRHEEAPDDDDLAEARALLEKGDAAVLSPAARLAWQQEQGGVVVFANGESRVFPESVLPCLVELCRDWRLEEESLRSALDDDSSDLLLNYLLECGCIYVE